MHKTKIGFIFVASLPLLIGGFSSFPLANSSEQIIDDSGTCIEEKDLTTPIECHADFVPQDTMYSSNQGVHLGHIGNITKVWDKYQGENIRIAVIDTGIDGDHPDFMMNMETAQLILSLRDFMLTLLLNRLQAIIQLQNLLITLGLQVQVLNILLQPRNIILMILFTSNMLLLGTNQL